MAARAVPGQLVVFRDDGARGLHHPMAQILKIILECDEVEREASPSRDFKFTPIPTWTLPLHNNP